MLISPDSNIVNTRGCGPLMKYWFRRGFWENIALSLFGVAMGAFMMFVYQTNRRQYTQLRDEAEDRKRIIHGQSTASLRSATNKKAKFNGSRYDHSGEKNYPSNGSGPDGYDSDQDELNNVEQRRPMLRPNP